LFRKGGEQGAGGRAERKEATRESLGIFRGSHCAKGFTAPFCDFSGKGIAEPGPEEEN